MSLISKLQSVFILLSAIFGIVIGQVDTLAYHAPPLIELFLMVLLFFVFAGVEVGEITRSFTNLRFSLTALAINFLWTPVFAYLLGRLFLQGSPDLQVGFLMLMVTPCTDWYLIFTGMSRGNVPLGSSILPMNLILQILLLPVYLWVFLGSAVSFAPSRMLYSVVMVLLVPLAAAGAVKAIARKAGKGDVFSGFVSSHGDNVQLLFLCLAVTAMFASQGRLLLQNPGLLLRLLPPLVCFFAVNFILALTVGKGMHMPFADRVALLFTTSARNSPVSLAIATISFPEHPVISLALVIGPLVELPVLALESGILNRLRPGPAE